MIAVSLADMDIFARTIWGEARGEPELGQIAVAWVIVNRLRRTHDKTLRDICQARFQFSCWNAGDANRARLEAVGFESRAFRTAFITALSVWGGEAGDPTDGARHYHNHTVEPAWARGHKPTAIIGNHLFYNDVR